MIENTITSAKEAKLFRAYRYFSPPASWRDKIVFLLSKEKLALDPASILFFSILQGKRHINTESLGYMTLLVEIKDFNFKPLKKGLISTIFNIKRDWHLEDNKKYYLKIADVLSQS